MSQVQATRQDEGKDLAAASISAAKNGELRNFSNAL